MVGKALIFDDSLTLPEKYYVRIFGAPISGLRIRYRRLMPELERIIQKILERKADTSDVSIIDVGCGTGLFTYEIAKHFPKAKILGIDNVPELIAKNITIARKAGLQNCDFQNRDVLTLSEDANEKARFDLAICIDNLEHVEDDEKVIRNIYNVLKHQGAALFHVPGLYRRWLFFSKRTNFDVRGHVRPGYTLEAICQKISDQGFVIQRSDYTYGWLETIANNISYLITGAERKNKYIYALAFPILNLIAYFGQKSRPKWGAGVAVIAHKV